MNLHRGRGQGKAVQEKPHRQVTPPLRYHDSLPGRLSCSPFTLVIPQACRKIVRLRWFPPPLGLNPRQSLLASPLSRAGSLGCRDGCRLRHVHSLVQVFVPPANTHNITLLLLCSRWHVPARVGIVADKPLTLCTPRHHCPVTTSCTPSHLCLGLHYQPPVLN